MRVYTRYINSTRSTSSVRLLECVVSLRLMIISMISRRECHAAQWYCRHLFMTAVMYHWRELSKVKVLSRQKCSLWQLSPVSDGYGTEPCLRRSVREATLCTCCTCSALRRGDQWPRKKGQQEVAWHFVICSWPRDEIPVQGPLCMQMWPAKMNESHILPSQEN